MREIRLDDEAATRRLGEAVARALRPGEAVCLSGPLSPNDLIYSKPCFASFLTST